MALQPVNRRFEPIRKLETVGDPVEQQHHGLTAPATCTLIAALNTQEGQR